MSLEPSTPDFFDLKKYALCLSPSFDSNFRLDIMSHTSYATIRAEDNPVYSKFTVKGGMWVNPNDHDEGVVPITFNANSDVSVPKFWSADKGLTLLYDTFNAGYGSFRGTIGAGRIFIKTEKGITIKGAISGGPAEGQSFVGSGTWIQG